MMITQRNRRHVEAKRRRGATVVLVAVMLVAIFSMVAFAVDLGSIVATKTNLQSAADAAALAGASRLTGSNSLALVSSEALNYGTLNAPDAVVDVSFGTWDAGSKSFTQTAYEPNAVRVVARRTVADGNAAPAYFSRVMGHDAFDVIAEAVAVGALTVSEVPSEKVTSVYVTSTKDLSNVVLNLYDSVNDAYVEHKFDGLNGYTKTFEVPEAYAGMEIVGVWIKSGCNQSGDGPGYGEYLAPNPDDPEATVHGVQGKSKGCFAQVTATFNADGVEFTESGQNSPVRLVK